MSDDPNDSSAQPEAESERKPFTYSDPATPEEYDRLRASREELGRASGKLVDRSEYGLFRSKQGKAPAWVSYTSLGIQMAVILAGPVWLGVWLGEKYDFKPWGAVIGFAFGGPASIAHVIIAANRMNDSLKKSKAREQFQAKP